MQERIVITGMGTVNPLGLNVSESWKNVTNGVSGVGPITLFNDSDLQVHIACEVKDFVPEQFMEAKETRRRDRFEQLSTAAVQEAIENSGLEITEANAARVGAIISSAIGGLKSLQDAVITNHTEGPRRVSPFLIPMLMSNGTLLLSGLRLRFRRGWDRHGLDDAQIRYAGCLPGGGFRVYRHAGGCGGL